MRKKQSIEKKRGRKIIYAMTLLGLMILIPFKSNAEIRTDAPLYLYTQVGTLWGLPDLDDTNCHYSGTNCLREIFYNGVYQELNIIKSETTETKYTLGDGDYHFNIWDYSTTTGNLIGFVEYTITNGVLYSTFSNTLISISPEYASTTTDTTTPITFSATGIVDGIIYTGVRITISNMDRPTQAGTTTVKYFSGQDTASVDYINGAGLYIGWAELILADGLTDPLGTTFGTRKMQFTITVGDTGLIPLSTAINLESCKIISFNLAECLVDLVKPDPNEIKLVLASAWSKIKYAFPIGYISSFWDIVQSTDKVALPTIDITVPEGIPGTNARLQLDLDNLDWLWNTETTFGTAEQKGKTFYEIVSPYWNTIVYLGLFVYIINRLLGSWVVINSVFARQDQVENMTRARNKPKKLKVKWSKEAKGGNKVNIKRT